MRNDFLTVEEVAKELAVEPTYVEHLLETGKLQGQKQDAEGWQISKMNLAIFMKRQ